MGSGPENLVLLLCMSMMVDSFSSCCWWMVSICQRGFWGATGGMICCCLSMTYFSTFDSPFNTWSSINELSGGIAKWHLIFTDQVYFFEYWSCAIVFIGVSAKAHFQYQICWLECVITSWQVFQRNHDNTANEHSTHKQSFCTPKHITVRSHNSEP